MAKKTIYGWEKQLNKDSCILEVTLKTIKFKVIDKITGEVKIKDICYLAYHDEARWFTSFNSAKRAMINDLLAQVIWRERRIKKLMKISIGDMK